MLRRVVSPSSCTTSGRLVPCEFRGALSSHAELTSPLPRRPEQITCHHDEAHPDIQFLYPPSRPYASFQFKYHPPGEPSLPIASPSRQLANLSPRHADVIPREFLTSPEGRAYTDFSSLPCSPPSRPRPRRSLLLPRTRRRAQEAQITPQSQGQGQGAPSRRLYHIFGRGWGESSTWTQGAQPVVCRFGRESRVERVGERLCCADA